MPRRVRLPPRPAAAPGRAPWPYAGAGFDHLVLMNAGPDPDGFLEFFTRHLAGLLWALVEPAAQAVPG